MKIFIVHEHVFYFVKGERAYDSFYDSSVNTEASKFIVIVTFA